MPDSLKRIAVGVGSSPSSWHLVEWTAKVASKMNVPWMAFHVDGGVPLSQEDTKRLEKNLRHAQALGGEISTHAGADVARTLVKAAGSSGASMLVIGRSGLSQLGFFTRSLTISDKILSNAVGLDIVVVSDGFGTKRRFFPGYIANLFSLPLRQYLAMAIAFILVTIGCLATLPWVGIRGVELSYLALILVFSLFSRPAPIILFTLVAALAYNFFFIPPRFTFSISSTEDILVFLLFSLVAATTGFLSSGLRLREALLLKRDRVASLLLSAGEHFSKINTEDDAAEAAAMLVQKYSGSTAVICLQKSKDRMEPFHSHVKGILSTFDVEAAKHCIVKGEICGAGNIPHAKARFRFVPAKAGNSVVASIGFVPRAGKGKLGEDDALFLALGKSLALAIEKERSDEISRKALLELESERLAKVLLDSVSHELRTPLTSITGSLSALKDEEIGGNPSTRAKLLGGALLSAEKLNKVVDDLLSFSRMEAGILRLKLEPITASYLAAAISAGVKDSLSGRRLAVFLPEKSHEYILDATLVTRLGINLVENACRYSRKSGGIELRFSSIDGGIGIKVRDEGPGFSDERMRDPFKKFSRTFGDQPGKLGLGLAMCKGIAEAHGGSINAMKGEGFFEIEVVFPKCEASEAYEIE